MKLFPVSKFLSFLFCFCCLSCWLWDIVGYYISSLYTNGHKFSIYIPYFVSQELRAQLNWSMVQSHEVSIKFSQLWSLELEFPSSCLCNVLLCICETKVPIFLLAVSNQRAHTPLRGPSLASQGSFFRASQRIFLLGGNQSPYKDCHLINSPIKDSFSF